MVETGQKEKNPDISRRHHAKLVFAGLSLLLIAIIALPLLRRFNAGGPFYQGKSFRAWLIQHGENSYPPRYNGVAVQSAADALDHIGTNALPTLLHWASMKSSSSRNNLRHLLSEDRADKLHIWSANDFHAAAAYGFGVLKSNAIPAVPVLARLLQDPDPTVRDAAANCVARIGPLAGEQATPALIQSLADPIAQDNALVALSGVGASPQVIASALIDQLSSTNTGQRGWAISHLSDFGTNGNVARSIAKFSNDPDPYLAGAASNALRRMDAANRSATESK